MDHLLYARSQMGLSLMFHMVFAAAGVALPLLMAIADTLHLRTGHEDWLRLTKRLSKGTSVLFAVGAVSGTVLSFELGLLWPRFMGTFGQVVGPAFSLEGFAFFTEAIFLGIYLYGRGRISRGLHLFSGYAVAVSGAASAFFVTLVNSIMNLPHGFRLENGVPVDVDPWAALFSPPWKYQVVHVLISCYQATAWAMAGIHAGVLLLIWRDRQRGLESSPLASMHRRAFKLSVAVAAVAALLQPLSGDRSAGHVARQQPWKLAAMEAQFRTERGAPLRIGGIPDVESQTVTHAIEIPYGLSLLAFHDPNAPVKGLEEFPRDEWPPVAHVHYAFQTMVAAGMWMAALAALTLLLWWRRREGFSRQLGEGWERGVRGGPRWLLWAWFISGPLGLVALEAGWLVTEWGRQPWIVHGMMRTREAVTPFPALAPPFWTFTLVYLFLGAVVLVLVMRQVRSTVPREAPRPEAAR